MDEYFRIPMQFFIEDILEDNFCTSIDYTDCIEYEFEDLVAEGQELMLKFKKLILPMRWI